MGRDYTVAPVAGASRTTALPEQAQHQRYGDRPGQGGGDLGWTSTANFVKPFGDAVAALPKGKYTETPVKTDFGYHVILVEDSRPLTPPPFDQVKVQLGQRLQQEQIQKMVGDLRAKAKVQ